MYINIIGHCTAFLPYLQVMRLLNCLAVVLSLTNRHVCCESVALQLFHIKIFFKCIEYYVYHQLKMNFTNRLYI